MTRAEPAGSIGARRPLILRVPILRAGVGISDLRAKPEQGSERVDQVRFGERLTLLASAGDWLFVQAREDHYFGWVRGYETKSLGGAGPEVPASHVVGVALAALVDRPQEDARVVGALSAGTWVDVGPARDGFVPVEGAWLRAADLVPAGALPTRSPSTADLVAAARAFLDVPYVWGGTSARGLDCSGFVQLAYRLCGVLLARDADQQATQGRRVDGAPRAGDLLFFETPITHVGMALDETRMIHAPRPIGRVLEQRIAERGSAVSIRRYLP